MAIREFLRTIIIRIVKNELCKFSAGEAERLATYLSSPVAGKIIAKNLSQTPTIWGDPSRVSTGENVHLVNALLNVSSGRIDIGSNTFFGHNVSLITGTHPVNVFGVERQTFPPQGRDIIIGNGVWIATNAVVIGPCSIGDNAVVAAGAVVIGGSIPSNTVYAGVPARLIRELGNSRLQRGDENAPPSLGTPPPSHNGQAAR